MTSGPPPTGRPHHAVLSLEVVGGFLGGARLEFVDGLNCFIGGRGAGKTTALELLRFGLGLMPDPKANPQRHRSIESLVKANLGSGRLRIELRTKTDMRYSVDRSTNESVQVVNEVGVALPISLDRDLIFGADVFSQNEIEEIASSPAAQLALLDRFQEEEALAITRGLSELQRELEQSGVDLRRLDEEIDALRGKAFEVVPIEERLKGLAEVGGPDAERLNAAHAERSMRTREEKVPGRIVSAMQDATRQITATTSAFQVAVNGQFEGAFLEGANREVFQALEVETGAFVDVLSAAVASVVAALPEATSRLQAQANSLAERHALQEAAYRAMVSESEEVGGRTAERTALQGALATALAAAKEQQAKQEQRLLLAGARTDLLNRVSELRDRRFGLRKRVAEQLSAQFASVRVTVAQASDLERYRELLADALKGAGVKQGMVADRIVQAFLPTELSAAIAGGDHTTLTLRTGFDDERAKRVLDGLRTSGAAYAIETVDLEDRPCIELLDGDEYKESPNLSTGQRCTTILPILLVQSERPLLVDQPEDNLDNAFVYDTIVKALRDVKGCRQVIFVTHNPNIPVLGEAERVFVFGSDGRHAALRQVGTVDECKEQIERILEGGRDAFLQRKARYGH